MQKTIGGFRRRRLEYPAFFYTTLLAFVGDALNTIQEKKWPDFGYSHPTPAIRANLGDWWGSRAYPEIGHDALPFARNVPVRVRRGHSNGSDDKR
jgi:hypothetical protein